MTREKPTRTTDAGRAYLDLQLKARQTNRMTDELLKLYVLEGFLTRLANSRFADDFVLKGGVLLAAYAARRPTRDVDLNACNLTNDTETVSRAVQEIVALHHADGLIFNSASLRSDVIREDDEYSGVRVSLTAHLASADINFHLDVNFGDPIWPEPASIELPLILGGSISLRGYPLHMVIAEKVVTAIQRGTANTRWRDFADIVTLTRMHRISGNDFCQALLLVAKYRNTELIPLSKALDGMEEIAQTKWQNWLRKQRIAGTLPEQFKEILQFCFVLCDPALSETVRGQVWNPLNSLWQ